MKTIPLIFALFVLASCATRQEKLAVQQKVENESQISDSKSLVRTVDQVIASSKTLTPQQKIDLKKIIDEAKVTNMILSEQSYKQKGVLIKELLAPKTNQREVAILKKSIRKTESLRLKNTLSAFNEIAEVIGKDPESQVYLEHMMFERAVH